MPHTLGQSGFFTHMCVTVLFGLIESPCPEPFILDLLNAVEMRININFMRTQLKTIFLTDKGFLEAKACAVRVLP